MTTAGELPVTTERAAGERWGPPLPVPSIAIRRARLEQILDEHLDQRVVLVRGPAGAGKSVLVAQWTTAQATPCAWLTLDSSHNDANLLVWHLIETVERLSLDANEIVVGRSIIGADIDDTILWDVLNSVTHRLGTTVNLVLDTLDVLRDRRARHVLSRLVEHPPEAVRIVLVSRSKPRLGLERARLRGDLVEIGPAALRFQRAEIDALASTWTDRHLDAAELEQATLGWAAGLRLAQLEAAAGDPPSLALGEPVGVVSEYVREELIEGSPDELRSFLEVTCWLPVLTGPMCAAIAGQRPGRPPLTMLEMEALPILPVPSRPGAFRYPAILAHALQQEYRRRDPGAARQALCRAAAACRQTGEFTTALELFLQAGEIAEAADVCGALAAGGEPSLRRVDELLHRRPELTPASSRLLPWRIRAAVAAGDLDAASALLSEPDLATAAADAPGQPDSQGMLRARAAVAEHLGDVAALLAASDRLLTAGRQGRDSMAADLQTHCWRIRALVWSGDIAAARAALRALDDAPVRSTVEVAVARAWVTWMDGDVSATVRAASAARRGEDSARGGEVALLLGSAQRERNQFAKAVPLLEEARTLATTYGHNVIAALAASELARCHRAAGASMDALELVVSARVASVELPLAVDVHLRSTEASIRLDQGDIPGALAVVRAAPRSIDAALLAARVALRQAPTRASALVETVSAHTPRQAVEKLLLRAQLRGAEAAEQSMALIKAVAIGEPLGLVRTFLDEGSTLSRHLSELAFEHRHRGLGRLGALARHELALAPAREASAPVEQLTARELAVLRMLPLRMSNREMAEQMYVSVNTLKTHVRAIYRKLDVPHRSAAVRRAKALQLL